MQESPLSIQLGQIEALQASLRETLLSEDQEGLDELLAEKCARLETVLAERDTAEFGARPVYARLLRILRTDHELQALINQQLALLSTELRKTTETQRLAGAYLSRPAAAAASTVRLLSDVSV